MPAKRFYEIDLLRFSAAAAVVLFHYTFRGAAGSGAFTHVSFPGLATVTKYGYLGVDLFFLISGFVILMSVEGKSARQFVISRIVRLYPAFWCCCTLTFLAMVFFGDDRFPVSVGQYLVNLTMLSELVNVDSIDGVYWSLLVEMKFYGLVFLLVLLGQVRSLEHYLGLWLAAAMWLSVCPIKWLCALVIPQSAAYFVAGATFYLIARRGNSLYRTVVLLISYVLGVLHAARDATCYGREYDTHFDIMLVALVLAGFYVLFYLIALGRTQWLRSEKYIWWGSLTYPLYLVHQNIGYLLFNALDGRIEKHVLLAGVITLMLAISCWVHWRIEVPYGPRLQKVLNTTWTRVANYLTRLKTQMGMRLNGRRGQKVA